MIYITCSARNWLAVLVLALLVDHPETTVRLRAHDRHRLRRSGRGIARVVRWTEVPEAPLGLKVFSATKFREREMLGEVITDWIRRHPQLEIVDKIVTQSSDAEFHCLAITIIYRDRRPS